MFASFIFIFLVFIHKKSSNIDTPSLFLYRLLYLSFLQIEIVVFVKIAKFRCIFRKRKFFFSTGNKKNHQAFFTSLNNEEQHIFFVYCQCH
jgi:hypothetical protein